MLLLHGHLFFFEAHETEIMRMEYLPLTQGMPQQPMLGQPMNQPMGQQPMYPQSMPQMGHLGGSRLRVGGLQSWSPMAEDLGAEIFWNSFSM